MSAYGRNFSTRLFIQAALTGLLAPSGRNAVHGSTWVMLTFALAAAAAVVGAIVRGGHGRTRSLVIGFEAAALLVGGVALIDHHYIPGTIVGLMALVTALNHPAPHDVEMPLTEAVAADGAPAPAPQFAAAAPAPQFAAPAPAPVEVPAQPAPVAEPVPAPVAPPAAPAAQPAPAATPVTGVRAMTILPGQ
jgi:hypothetical protein